ncbi:MAG: hypothetical protein FWD49_06590 [Firmicutes bacterium]|nr:hypothetical protein [Bacillota bacterium]
MATIHRFLKDAKFYFDSALASMAGGNYETAVKELLHALYLEKNDDYLRVLADCYFCLNSYSASSQAIYELMRENPSVEHLLMLARNRFFTNGGENASDFLFETIASADNAFLPDDAGLEEAEDDEILSQIIDSWREPFNSPDLVHLKASEIRDSRNLLRAIKEFESGNYDKTIMFALNVKKDSEKYLETLELITVSASLNGDTELLKEKLNELKDLDPASAIAFKIEIEAMLKEGKSIKDPEVSTRIDIYLAMHLEEKSDSRLLKIQGMLIALGAHAHGFKVSEMILDLLGASEFALFNHAVCAYAIGKKEIALKSSQKLSALYPNDSRGKVVAYLAENKPRVKEWRELLYRFPSGRIHDIYFAISVEMVRVKEGEYITRRAIDLIDILLLSEDSEAVYLLEKIIKTHKGLKAFLLSKLYDEYLSVEFRFDLLKVLLYGGINTMVVLPVEDRVLLGKIKSATRINDSLFNDVYSNVLIALFETDDLKGHRVVLESAVAEMSLTKSRLKRLNILCAVAHYYTVNDIFSADGLKYSSEMFGTTVSSLKKYLKEYRLPRMNFPKDF